MKNWKKLLLALGTLIVALGLCFVLIIRREFRATSEPSYLEKTVARRLRNFAIPSRFRREKNPLTASADLQTGRELFLARCANCHGIDGTGMTPVGRNLYPRVPNLHSSETQELTDGEIHYIIQNGVQLSGMPAWGDPHQQAEDSWQLVLFIRNMRPLTATEETIQRTAINSAHYVGSQSCAKCHGDIYGRWKKTPMANVVREPRDHPDAFVADLATNLVAKFSLNQVAFV